MKSAVYQIRVRGQLDPKLSAWFGDFVIAHTADGDTRLTGIVIDQAALYGVLARCRDMGVTLLAVNSLAIGTTERGVNSMSNVIRADASYVINARPEEIYAVISDYHVGHPAILPKGFTGLIVEKGGKGAGTLVLTKLTVYGKEYTYHQLVSEPEPGRVLVETDIDTGQFSSFTLDPVNGGAQTRVTIHAEEPAKPGVAGWLAAQMQPMFMKRMFAEELRNLAAYVQQQRVAAAASRA